MKMHLAQDKESNLIRACTASGIVIGEQTYTNSIVVTATTVSGWSVDGDCFEALRAMHFDQLLDYQPELILVGTGKKQHFPPPSQYARLIGQGVGIEFMTTAAACRTYNIVMMEGRKALAALVCGAD